MTQVIYGDILFIINFSMDFLSLFITGKILRNQMKPFALIIASAIGSIYALVNLMVRGSRIFECMISLGVSLLMCYIVFGGTHTGAFVRSSILFYGVNFILGGGMTALFHFFNQHQSADRIYINGTISTFYSDIPFLWFLVLAGISALLSFAFGRIFREKSSVGHASVTVTYHGQSVSFDCLSDSGNLLCEPISGKPVIITDYQTLHPVLPEELREVFRSKDTTGLDRIHLQYMRHIRMIPVSTVGHNGILIGFIPDSVSVNGVKKEACIAVDSIASDETERYGGYNAVMPAILTE